MNFDLAKLSALLGFFLVLILIRVYLRWVFTAFRPEPSELACTWKFRTVVFVALAFAVPLWPLTFPLFLGLGRSSYLAGAPSGR
ncbi:hypothetical protein [Paucibacter sp. DJ2R-2]|uniref:hypothetical protein n=1 Tax=Paucibacter sp. DJ2R-2 TaxID=2893558 RepID=UPI0021E45DD6|nr:hypothetical protein [Paucibacter sp. DJ2R-2]MCV2419195.1 hypothetical protein [Paucibacter sp. DJ4R-1]MCV2437850.1 hypothetical protein [Paucibacter sp. DJ2R-2]